MKLQYRIPLAMYSVWCIIAILLCKDGLYQGEPQNSEKIVR